MHDTVREIGGLAKHQPFGSLPHPQDRRSLICVAANKIEKPPLRLRTAGFDQACEKVFGRKTPQKIIATALNTHPTCLSQYRSHKRQPTSTFIADTLTTFPTFTFDQLFEVDREQVSA